MKIDPRKTIVEASNQTSLTFIPGFMFQHASTIPTSTIQNIVGNNTLPKIIINTCTSSTLCKIAVAIQKSNKKDQSSARHLLTWNSPPSKSQNNCQYLANPSFNRCNFIYTGQFLKFHLKGNLSNIQAAKHTKKWFWTKTFVLDTSTDFFSTIFEMWLFKHTFQGFSDLPEVCNFFGKIHETRTFLWEKMGRDGNEKRDAFLTGRFKTWKICGIFGGSSWKG